VNTFHVCGTLLAVWAVLASFLGITREGFPATPGATRAVGAISVVLTILAIGSAIYSGATENEEGGGGEGEAALILPL
jgi:hypothetical protein